MKTKVIKINVDYDTGYLVSEFSNLGLSVSQDEREVKGKNKTSFWSYNDKFYLASDYELTEDTVNYVKDVLNNDNFYYMVLFTVDENKHLKKEEDVYGYYIPKFDDKDVIQSIVSDFVSEEEIFEGFITDEVDLEPYITRDLESIGYRVLEVETIEKLK